MLLKVLKFKVKTIKILNKILSNLKRILEKVLKFFKILQQIFTKFILRCSDFLEISIKIFIVRLEVSQ